MKYINKILTGSLIAVSAMAMLTACNKDMPAIDGNPPTSPVVPSNARALGDTLARIPADTMFYKILARAGKLTLLNDKTKSFTIFAPDNNAVKTFITAASGGLIPSNAPDANFVGFINGILRTGQADTLVSYHIIPQAVPSANIPTSFPNMAYPTLFNPATTVSPLARLDNYISRRANGAWTNNIPVITPDILAANGVIHTIAAVNVPPSQLLLQRIAGDANLSYLWAAIQRADSGAVAGNTTSLQYYLGNSGIALGANFTLFAPTNQAFKNVLYATAFPIVRGQLYAGAYAQAIGGGATPDQAAAIATGYADANAPAQTIALTGDPAVFQNPALFPYLTATTLKGILFYHLLSVRTFSVNIPTTATSVFTLLNSAIPAHPGISVKATFTGPFVSAATVKGLGNGTDANLLVNPFPGGTSDQHYVNGVLHQIDQVLLPQ